MGVWSRVHVTWFVKLFQYLFVYWWRSCWAFVFVCQDFLFLSWDLKYQQALFVTLLLELIDLFLWQTSPVIFNMIMLFYPKAASGYEHDNPQKDLSMSLCHGDKNWFFRVCVLLGIFVRSQKNLSILMITLIFVFFFWL